MRILHILSGREINGAVMYTLQLARRQSALGHKVWVMVRPDSWAFQQAGDLECVPCELDRWRLRDFRQTRQFLKQNRIDLVHSHMSRAHNFAVGLKMRTRIPIVATAHASRWQLHWRFHDLVIANSQATAQYLASQRLVSPERLKVTYCFVELSRFLNVGLAERDYYRRELHLKEHFAIGIVGDVTHRKGHRILFEAFSRALEQHAQLRLILIGRFHRRESYVRQLRKFQLHSNLRGRVAWLGIRTNIHEYLPALDLLTVPSLREPLGLAAVEGQAAGVPVIASRTGGLPEIVEHEKSGWLVPPGDSAALCDQLMACLADMATTQRVAAAARKQVTHRFDPAELTQAVLGHYAGLLQGPATS